MKISESRLRRLIVEVSNSVTAICSYDMQLVDKSIGQSDPRLVINTCDNIYIPSFTKSGPGVQAILRFCLRFQGGCEVAMDSGDLISPLLLFQNLKNWLKKNATEVAVA
jgi:hypothetical protein